MGGEGGVGGGVNRSPVLGTQGRTHFFEAGLVPFAGHPVDRSPKLRNRICIRDMGSPLSHPPTGLWNLTEFSLKVGTNGLGKRGKPAEVQGEGSSPGLPGRALCAAKQRWLGRAWRAVLLCRGRERIWKSLGPSWREGLRRTKREKPERGEMSQLDGWGGNLGVRRGGGGKS